MSLYFMPQDKANHVVYGAAIAALYNVVFPDSLIQHSMFVVAVFAVAKEAIDYIQKTRGAKHSVELLDVVATIGGGLLANSANF